ncbi:McrB family protein [Nonlabens sp. Asnod3-A02]|uniref:McrB family protein n=1 Tax=Nonlabens sp. Asnod3-A02 TaxID=3160579 RepID=UPI00386A34CF
MRREQAEKLYEYFNLFIQEFLINGNSILTEHKNILSNNTLEACNTRYNENYDDSKKNFDEKVIQQFEGASIEERLVFAHIEWLWAYSVYDISNAKKLEYTKRTTRLNNDEINKELYREGFGSAGQWHTNNKYFEILFNLRLIQYLFSKIKSGEISRSVPEIKKHIEAICLFNKYQKESIDYPISDEDYKSLVETGSFAQTNILLYLGFPEKYERIPSNNHKSRIYASFYSLLTPEQKDSEELNLDEKILIIREQLEGIIQEKFDFYEHFEIRKIWNNISDLDDFTELQGLHYKKAIVLYGPPGTSKTHSAFTLSKALVRDAYLKNRANVESYLQHGVPNASDYIHHLQLHPNYTYEDFVVGYQLKDGNTIKTPGSLFEICEKASKDKGNMPHVLILDEINRIDLSKLFGEVFSALENRDKGVQVSIGGIELTIPSNLYVIGTMNEIDFSLEQIDFALRRRFLWYFYGFNRHTLKSIIASKNTSLKTKLNFDTEVERFLNNAKALNDKISAIQELGKEYQLGHTFFGEIVDIYKSYKDNTGLQQPKNKIYRKDGPIEILWNISLEPMIVSFLGNIEPEEAITILKDLKKIYLNA